MEERTRVARKRRQGWHGREDEGGTEERMRVAWKRGRGCGEHGSTDEGTEGGPRELGVTYKAVW